MFQTIEQYNSELISILQLQLDRLEEIAEIFEVSDSGTIISANQIFALPPDDRYISEYERRLSLIEERGKGFPFDNVVKRFALSPFEALAVLIAYAGIENPVSLGFAVNVFKTHSPLRIRADFIRGLEDKLFRFFLTPDKRGTSLHSPLKLKKRMLLYIAGAHAPKKHYMELYRRQQPVPLPYASCDLEALADLVGSYTEEGKIIHLYGEAGSGKKTAVKRAADTVDKNILFIDMNLFKDIPASSIWAETEYFIRESILEDALPCFYNTDSLKKMNSFKVFIRDLLKLALRSVETVFVTQNEYNAFDINENQFFFAVRMPNMFERAALWHDIAGNNAKLMANSFALSPKQIEEASREARIISGNGAGEIDIKLLSRCCYHQTITHLTESADRIPVTYGWNDLIVSPEIKETLKEACNHIKYSDVVLEKWGVKKRAGYGVGVSLLFAGPPGTGKTMAAQVIANELNMDLYKIDTSKIVSKYIGETEKRLRAVFDEGKKSNVILFFDEMDSLFGTRTEIKDSHDKYANMQTSYILQRIEEYEGVILLATNFRKNIDEAFMRRIQYVIYFTIPNADYRRKLWEGMFPEKAPLSADVDFDYLAESYELSGGVIKNIVISAAFYAASEKKSISMKHIMKALQIELSKQGKILIKEDFGDYSHYYSCESGA